MQTTTLLLLRHAHTDANEHGSAPRMAGWWDLPLSDAGDEQLRRLDPACFGPIAGIVYSSTAVRALRTAAAAAGGRAVVPLRSLREISCGEFEGWLVADVEAQHPELWRRNLAQDDPDFAWPGGESYRHFRGRAVRALRGIAARHPGQRVLVVTHAGLIAQAVGHLRGLSPACWERNRPPNCSVTTVECAPGGGARLVDFGRDVTAAADARPHGG